MKIFVTSIGTRGDVEPFLAVGELLKKQGHDIVYCFPVQFKHLLPDHAKFYPLSAEFIELINSKEGSTVMGNANMIKKIKALYRLYQKGKEVSKRIANEQVEALQTEQPDLIIQHPKCAVPFLWHLKYKTKIITSSPVPFVLYPVKDHPHIGWPNFKNSVYIRLSYKVSEYAWIKQIYDVQSKLRTPFNFSKSDIRSALFRNKFLYGVSPQLFQRPDYWPEQAQILGHHERKPAVGFKPSEDIENFIETHEKILFLTFGSMVNDNPEQTSKLFYKVVDELGMPCIVNTSSGGLVPVEDYANNLSFLFLDRIPYSWLFKRIYAVIHHGGSGSTHMGITHGLPTLIIPHIIDQFMWNRLISEKELGPKGVSINKISSKAIKPLIEKLYNDEAYKKNAEAMALKMRNANMDEELINFIEN